MRASLVAGIAVLCCVTTASPAVAQETEVTHHVVRSFDGTPIHSTLFLPAGDRPAPLVLRSHGWGGHGERGIEEASSTTRSLLDAGYGVLTWDERGFGYSGGEAAVLKPELEGRDVSALIDHVATDPAIAPRIACETPRDANGSCPDPVLGMSGQSYGGGVQLLAAAFDGEFSTTGQRSRIDAITPEITWNDLRYSLYDNGVVNFGWSQLLYVAGLATSQTEGLSPANPAGPQAGGLHPQLHRAQLEGVATNQLSAESVDFFGRSSLGEYGLDHPVAVPTLFLQGSVDTLFDLTEAAHSFHHVQERAPAKLVAFCGGHVQCPADYADAADREFLDGQILSWFDRHLRQNDVDTGPPVVYRTNEGIWRSANDFPPTDARSLTASGRGQVVSTPIPTPALSPTPPGLPLTIAQPNPPGDPHAFSTEVTHAADGPAELVGIPRARVRVTGIGPETHLFLKLVDRETGQVVNLQEAPLRVTGLSPGAQEFVVEMPGIAYTLNRGHHLDLQVSTTSLMHATARTPAHAEVEATVEVPVR